MTHDWIVYSLKDGGYNIDIRYYQVVSTERIWDTWSSSLPSSPQEH